MGAEMDESGPATTEKMPIGYEHASAPLVPESAPPRYQSNSGDVNIVVSMSFVKSVEGILKVIQMVFGLVTFICATVVDPWLDSYYESCSYYYYYHNKVHAGMVWMQIASMITFLLTAILYVLHTFKIPSKFSEKVPFKFIEFVYYMVGTMFYVACGVVSSIFAGRDPAIAAAAFFSYASMLLYGADTIFRYTRMSGEGPNFCLKKPSSSPNSSGSSAASLAVAETLY